MILFHFDDTRVMERQNTSIPIAFYFSLEDVEISMLKSDEQIAEEKKSIILNTELSPDEKSEKLEYLMLVKNKRFKRTFETLEQGMKWLTENISPDDTKIIVDFFNNFRRLIHK